MKDRTPNLETDTNESLAARYAKAAELQGRATEAGDHDVANRAHREIATGRSAWGTA